MPILPDRIIVTVGIDNDKIISHAYYNRKSFLLVNYVLNFEPQKYNKHLFSRVGEKLGKTLFLEAKRISLPKNTHFYNGYKFVDETDEIVLTMSNPVSLRIARAGSESSLDGDELETFCSAFRYGLENNFFFSSSVGLIEFAETMSKNFDP